MKRATRKKKPTRGSEMSITPLQRRKKACDVVQTRLRSGRVFRGKKRDATRDKEK